MKDIAAACHVSVAAVSIVLSGNVKKGRISEAKKQEILDTARKLNYYPNSAASNLAKGSSRTVGIVINDIRNSHIAEIDTSISRKLQEKGFSVSIYLLDEQKEKDPQELIRQLASRNLCALVWAKSYEPQAEAANRRFREVIDALGIPVITMDIYDFRSEGVNICFDYEMAGYDAVRYLIECGHRRIGVISGIPTYQVTMDRLKGCRRAHEEAGLNFEPELIFEGDYTMESGSRALSYLMGQHVTAIFAMNDEMAFGVYRSARIYGIRIPGDLSVIGCDNVPFDEVLEVPLTTVGVPAREMGNFIGEQVCRAVEEHPEDMKNDGINPRRTIYYKPNLYVRGSVRKIEV